MTRCFTLAALTLFTLNAFAADDPQTAPPEPSEMKAIFNGKDLTGWDGAPRLWSVKHAAIHGETTADHAANGADVDVLGGLISLVEPAEENPGHLVWLFILVGRAQE